MKFSFRRVMSLVLALVMVLGMVPSIATHAHAATTTDFAGSSVADLGISATAANGSGTGENAPVCSWTASGTAITGTLTGGKDPVGPQTYYYASTSILTLTNNKSTEAELSFSYSATTNGSAYGDITVNGTKYTNSASGEVSVTLAAGESITITLHVPERKKFSLSGALPEPNGASITISNLQLVGQGVVTVNFAEAENGSYTVTDAAGAAVTVPGSASAKSTDRFTMTATPSDGYAFAGWYNAASGKYLSADQTFTTLFAEDATVTAKFIPAADGVYGVGTALFTDLTAAAQAAEGSTNKTVILLKDATLTGAHTIPAGVTLLIPYDAAHSLNTAEPATIVPANSEAYVKPAAFRTLTMASGASITVNGAISVNAPHISGSGSKTTGGTVYKAYGAIKMTSGSAITLNNGANLYAWGYVWGDGTVTAKSGATVYEKMQITDFRGGSNTSTIALRNALYKSDGAFPFNQYYIQNVEVTEIFHDGAILKAHAAVTMDNQAQGMAVEFIGTSSAMFNVTGATITKKYNPATDRLSLSIDGDENSYAELNGMAISLGGVNLNCANFTLPINSNIDININAGAAVVNQELVLQPGVKIFVDSDAMLATNANIYVMDIDQWGAFVFSGKRQAPLVYSPSLNGGSSRTIASDAVVDINGYVMAIGGLFTTAGGAQVISSQKTGMIEMSSAAPADSTVAQLTGGSDVNKIAVTAAQLTNGNEAKPFTATKGAAEGDVYVYCSECDTWHREADGCYSVAEYTITFHDDEGNVLESFDMEEGATPAYSGTPTKASTDDCHDFVFKGWATSIGGQVINIPAATTDADYYAVFERVTNENHDTTVFIYSANDDGTHKKLLACCGEVVNAAESCSDGTDKDHNCDNCGAADIEGHTPGTAVEENRVEATCGTAGSYNAVVYCTECGEKLSSTPSTIPATGNHVDGDDANHDCDNCPATNVDGGHHGGTATCVAKAVCDECGQSYGNFGDHEYNRTVYTNITATHHTVSHICKHDATHIENDEPVEHTYVNGVCACEAVKNYTVTWIVEGETTKATVAHGAVPTAPAAEKADTAEYDYTFSHWVDEDGKEYTEIPAASADVTYTAVFSGVKQVYTITWNVEGVKTTSSVAYGETPVYDGTPAKDKTAEYTYTFDGWNPAVAPVTGSAEYTAQFTAKANQYVLTFNYNYEDYLKQLPVDYNVTIAADSMKYYSTHTREGYTLVGWNTAADGSGEPVDVTQDFTMPAHDVTIYAQWKLNEYTVTWNVAGTQTTTTVKHGETPVFAGTPVKEADAQYTYTFNGWTPKVVAATGEATYTAQFTPVLRSYDITFVVDGVETKVETKYGETPVYSGTPTKESTVYYTYTFAGWDQELVPVTGAATYTATWTETPVEYTITFVIDGETFHMEKGGYGTYVDTSDMPSTDKTGYTFAGWDTVIPETFPAENIVITGSHTVNRYTITFKGDFNTELDDGFADYTITKNYGEAITAADLAALEATLPTIIGHEFLGWYYAEEVEIEGYKVWEHTSAYEIPGTMGAADVTVYANWETISYELLVLSSIDNEIIIGANMRYAEYYKTLEQFNDINGFCYDDSRVEEGYPNLLPEGYSFAGYKYLDGSDVTFPYTHPADDVTIVVQFVPNNYTVNFMDGDSKYHELTAAYGSSITAPAAPTKEGYVFAGWVDAEGNAASLTTMPLNGLTVYASWTVDSFKLNFFATQGDATAAATFEIPFGTELTEEYMAELLAQVSAPTREGHTFRNWNVSGLPATMPAEAVNVYGEWDVNGYLLYFENPLNADVNFSAVMVYQERYDNIEEFLRANFDVEKELNVKGYTFTGFRYEDGTDVTFPYVQPAHDVTIQAKYQINTYTITFDVADIDSITADYGSTITWPGNPTKEGHTFLGWSTDGENVMELPETMPADGLNLKAVWARNTVYINWIIDGVETAEEYKYGDAIIAPEATKAADAKYTYKFTGWDKEVPATAVTNDTYTAQFDKDEAVKYTVKFVDGETTVYETQIAWNGEVTLEGFQAPTKTGHTLTWTVAGEEVSFPYAMDTKEVSFVANWTPVTYTITADGVAYPFAYGTAVSVPDPAAKEGHTFNSWLKDGEAYDLPETMPAEDIVITSDWTVNTYTLTVQTYDADGIFYEEVHTVSYGAALSDYYLETPSFVDSNGWLNEFNGWSAWTWSNQDDATMAYYEGETMPASDVMMYPAYSITGWYTEENGTTYLVKTEKVYFTDWAEIDGSEYWFDANSYIVKDITLIDGSYYAFDHESGAFLADYTGIYTASNGELYYVENGVAVANKGLTKTVDADGHIHYYYFGCGMANCDCDGCTGEYIAQKNNTHWAEIDNGYLVKWDYTFDENGVVIHDEDTSKNGIHKDEGVKYYYIDGVKVHYGLFIGDDGEYYYARSNGSLVVSRDYWISESHLNGVERDGAAVEEGSYTFDAEGRIVWPITYKSGIYAEDGSLYYYENGERTYAGLITYTGELHEEKGTISGVYSNDVIYVRTNGELAVNRSYWPTKNNGLMASATYNFDEYGRMIRTIGFVNEDGGIYYYVNGSRYHAGLIKVNGSYYYVKSSGQVVTGCRYWITHTNGYDVAEGSYEFAADGKMIIPEPEVLKNGIVEENGVLNYYVDGKLNYAGLIQYTGTLTREDGTVVNYENAWIYVRTSGELVVGRGYWVTKHNGNLEKSATYQFDQNGIMQK